MTKVGIINVTGYAGVELARLLHQHHGVELVSVTGRSLVGRKLADVFPHLADIDLTIEAELTDVDVAFSALPHGSSAEALLPLIKKGIKVVDISADFRLKNKDVYEQWYKVKHPVPELLEKAAYGLPELHRKEIVNSNIIANLGCYPTSAILGLAPASLSGLIEPDIIVDSKSGISGAGRTLSLTVHYSEINENTSAYALEGHRHMPEIMQELETGGKQPSVLFLPHLVPMTRGILSSCYAPLKKEASKEEVRKIYRDFYKDEPFVKVVDAPPQTKQTWGNNMCLIYATVDPVTKRLVVVSCIDNLVKGAAGQAIQNMNLILGIPETSGLDYLAVYP